MATMLPRQITTANVVLQLLLLHWDAEVVFQQSLKTDEFQISQRLQKFWRKVCGAPLVGATNQLSKNSEFMQDVLYPTVDSTHVMRSPVVVETS